MDKVDGVDDRPQSATCLPQARWHSTHPLQPAGGWLLQDTAAIAVRDAFESAQKAREMKKVLN